MRYFVDLAFGLLACAALGACSASERMHDAPLLTEDAPPSDMLEAGAPPSELVPHAAPALEGASAASVDAGPELWVTSSSVCTTPGEIGAIFRGVPVYCQVPGPTGYYQCDELANRFLRDTVGHPNIDNVVTEYASSMCAQAAAMPAYSVHGGHFAPTSGTAPAAGDLIVWSGTPGHVAVVTSAVGGVVSYVQQNVGRPADHLLWDGVAPWPTECWVHPEPAPPPLPANLPDCGCFDGNGDYCGLSVVDHAAWYGCKPRVAGGGAADYGHLYACNNGVFTAKRSCKSCITALLTDAKGVCGDP